MRDSIDSAPGVLPPGVAGSGTSTPLVDPLPEFHYCSVCSRACRETFSLRDPETLARINPGPCCVISCAVRLVNRQWERAALKVLKSMGCMPEAPALDADDALLCLSIMDARFKGGVYERNA